MDLILFYNRIGEYFRKFIVSYIGCYSFSFEPKEKGKYGNPNLRYLGILNIF